MRLKTVCKFVLFSSFVSSVTAGFASDLDTMGVSLLRAVDPTLLGTGVRGAQPEASIGTGWQVNPPAVGQLVSLFTYISTNGSSSTFPNALGTESGHANAVGANFYGNLTGVAPGINHVDNYDANSFYQVYVGAITGPVKVPAKIVNQSFVFTGLTVLDQQQVDKQYDNAAQFNTLFVSGADNSGAPKAPSTAYNGLSVAAFGGDSAVGPTSDNGRSKPDLTAPAAATSFSTPYVSGAATILVQAGARGDGGTGTSNAATDIRTLKALLLNGAVKPSNWVHTATAPLDTRYGAGIVNVFNSYKQLVAGKHPFIESTTVVTNDPHPPGTNIGNIISLTGWDTNTIASTNGSDRVNHYYFNLPDTTAKNFTHTATLVWNRQTNAVEAKNLDLFLYNTANGSLVASSVSSVDNVEHLYIPSLPAGRYDLQVWKPGGSNLLKGTEVYALAFTSYALSLNITKSGPNVVISWPLAPAGFRLQSTPNLNPPIAWSEVTNTVVVTNSQNQVMFPASNSAQFFRLVSP
ncbi:MAG: hypothetical protein ABI042_15165 [Verrucomicrobiota bacterium]